MSTKDSISDQLNEIMELNVDWTKMGKEDLEKISRFFNEPYRLIQLGVNKLKTKAKEDLLNRPLGEILQSSDLLGSVAGRGRGGPLGLGILPSIFGGRSKSKEAAAEKTAEKPAPEIKPTPAAPETLSEKPLAEEHKNEQKPQP